MKTLQQVAAIVESSNNQFAIRFEPTVYANPASWIEAQVNKIVVSNHCSYDTGLMIASSSWGFYQILGANIYAGNYASNIFDYVETPAQQLEIFTTFIKQKGYDPGENVSMWNDTRFANYAKFYNGPGDVSSYVAAMKRALVV